MLTRPQRADLVADLGEEHAGHRHADALPKSVHLDVDGEGRKVLLLHGCCATSASATRLGRTPEMYAQGPAPWHRPSSRRYKSRAATAIRVPRQGEGRLLAHYRRGLKESAWITIIVIIVCAIRSTEKMAILLEALFCDWCIDPFATGCSGAVTARQDRVASQCLSSCVQFRWNMDSTPLLPVEENLPRKPSIRRAACTSAFLPVASRSTRTSIAISRWVFPSIMC